ncbi:MAG TPA: LacI family transcriptional regulator [Mesotoga infera]|uniref:Transcriptional regulator n=1 Tax=Mesotoga infera TaxID=1236046 RepID=A0A117M9A2_9BACT|nr:MAG: Transcriptional regulator [Mesotoga infera]KUK91422.1 MAG: Transcriptional regulator [Mesotoga infera]HCO69253.1 LacI family transcriptional regulator [Mesotoga infera]
MKRPTIKDVASLSGVGTGTVSRVLNGGSVKETTRIKVIRAIEKLGYQPNQTARTLAGGKTRRILFLMPEVRTEFHWRVMKSFDDFLDMMNYEMVIYPVFSDRRLNRLKKDSSLLEDSDGAVICTMNTGFLAKNNINFGNNVVLFEAQSEEFDCVYLDNIMGGKMAAELLIDCGSSDFFVISFEEENPILATENFEKRIEGFTGVLENKGYEFNQERLVYTSFFFETAYEKIAKILTEHDKPGIFALADNFALEVLQTASALKKIPGKDFFLIGYDNQSWTERAGLTTIEQPMEDMGRKTAELIVQKIEAPGQYIQPVKFLPKIKRRRTA